MLYNIEIYVYIYILYGVVYLTQDMSCEMCYAGAWRFKKFTSHCTHISYTQILIYQKKNIIIIINIKIVRTHGTKLHID